MDMKQTWAQLYFNHQHNITLHQFLTDLCSAVGVSSNPNPDVVLLNTVYNVSDWMKPMRFGLHNII